MNFKNHNIDFNPIEHCYRISKVVHKPVSKIISKYIPTFNTNYWAPKKAKDEGVLLREIKEKWDISRDYSNAVGKALHYYIHMFLKYNKKMNSIVDIQPRIDQFHTFLSQFKDKIEIIETELIIAHDTYKIAGTLDCLCRNKKTGEYIIIDWKTNKEIKRKNSFGNMLAPLSHLENCEFNKYSLQLAFYKNILKSNFNIDIRDGCLIHFPIFAPYVVIPTRNMDNEVNTILTKNLY